LENLLSNLFKDTDVKPDLVRTMQMGPWTHRIDDGLETRKTAYEMMYTLVSIHPAPTEEVIH
jgi:cullin-associated NEDD8-dissociated protein 1